MSEEDLNYWREDSLLNEHHEHWHLVYPCDGQVDDVRHSRQELRNIRAKKAEPRFKTWHDRHGELFAYMHSQMLARYNAERYGVGLLPVVPLDDYRAPIVEGYKPSFSMFREGKVWHPSPRPPDTILNDLTLAPFAGRPGAKIAAQEMYRERLRAAATATVGNNRPSSLAEFAERVEPTDRHATNYFGALHNDGHLLISLFKNHEDEVGVMFSEMTAVRDPVFYRWHKHIDDLFRAYQDVLEPYEFTDGVPAKVLDIWLESASGKDRVTTTIRQRPTILPVPRIGAVPMCNYLTHEEFSIHIRVENEYSGERRVTARVFIAPEVYVEDRSAWIEMDKFCATLLAGETRTISRESPRSSVVRHPVLTEKILEGQEPWPDESLSEPGCRCGWPYTLLVPRGRQDGAEYRLMVMLTPGEDIIRREILEDDNSASYCGVVDDAYPDCRAMGYPFDRPFKSSLRDWIAGSARPKSVASREIMIFHNG